MEYADRVEIVTPEGVDLSIELAGLGSRFIGELIDLLLEGVIILALGIVLYGIGGGVPAAVFAVASFLVFFFYNVLFEVRANGRTPGKSGAGIRVIRAGGEPVDFRASTIRNLLRLVDGPLTAYVAGLVSITASAKNQRLGDMAADTLVVRDQKTTAPVPRPPSPIPGDQWDTSAISAEELSAVRQYLDRRWQLEHEARNRLAWQLAEGLRPKVAGVPDDVRGEAFLERLAAAKAARG